jgi:hypothetical protein
MDGGTRLRSGELALGGLAAALLAVAVAVRGIRGDPPIAPVDRPREPSAIAEPMQLLRAGSELRVSELSERISPEVRREWSSLFRMPYALDDCPPLGEWLVGLTGQRFERLLGDLRRGSREDALGALALTFQLARATEWKPGFLGDARHAERLAPFFEDWLRAWGERAADDATLGEPALAALCVWSRVARSVVEAPVIGSDDAAQARASAFLRTLVGDGRGRRTRLAAALEARFPAAAAALADTGDPWRGLAREAERAFPEIDGECDE